MIISLLRHGEAIKNLQFRHGTVSQLLCPLTPKGITQAREAARKLLASGIKYSRLLHTARQQCQQTAAVASEFLGICAEEYTGIRAFDLGILEGLSDYEVELRYPELAVQMNAYRAGRLELHEVQIPNATDPLEYYCAGQRALEVLLRKQESFILVASRSVLILVASVLLGRTPAPSGGYREIPWANGAFVTFHNNMGLWDIEPKWSNMSIPGG